MQRLLWIDRRYLAYYRRLLPLQIHSAVPFMGITACLVQVWDRSAPPLGSL